MGIFGHNVCIGMESLGCLFSVKLSALDDRAKSDFVSYIIGKNKIWQTDTSGIKHSIKACVSSFSSIQVFVIGNSEVDSVLSCQYFLTMTLHRREHSNGENF